MSHHQPYDSLSSQKRSPFINALNNISSPSSHSGQSGQGTLNRMTVKCHNRNRMLTTSFLNQLLRFLNCDKGNQGFSTPVLKRSDNLSWSANHQWTFSFFQQKKKRKAFVIFLGSLTLSLQDIMSLLMRRALSLSQEQAKQRLILSFPRTFRSGCRVSSLDVSFENISQVYGSR